MALRTYTLEIVYDDESDTIEHVQEYISASAVPVFVPTSDEVEIDEEVWESINTHEIVGES